jgi:Fe2+ transport system protein B
VSKYTGTNICKIIVANKADINQREVTNDMIREFEKKMGIKIMEVSAKTGEGVDEAFKTVVKNLITKKYLLLI